MPAIEHYAWSGWFTLAILGAYATAFLTVISMVFRGIHQSIRRLLWPSSVSTSP